MEQEKEPFTKLYDWMVWLPLSWNQKFIYAIIYNYSRNGEVCFVSQYGLAKRLGMCESAVSRAIGIMTKKGLIKKIHNEDGGQTYVAIRPDWNIKMMSKPSW